MGIIVNRIHTFLHFFYKPFSRLLTEQQFRYIACGGFMALLDVCIFSAFYYYLFHSTAVKIGKYFIAPHIAAFWLAFPIGFILSFLCSKYIVFTNSTLSSKKQLFRYIILVILCQLLSYVLLRFFIEKCHFLPAISKITTTIIVAVLSYLWQKYISFKGKVNVLPN